MMELSSIGLVELSSIASGFEVADGMLKTSSVELLLSRTICSGKYIVMVAGSVADVRASVEQGISIAGESYIEHFIIPNIHPDVLAAIHGGVECESRDALGIIEAFSVAALIEGADAARKAANVTLLEVRVAMALGGKPFVVLGGSVADVKAAVEAGAELIGRNGLLVNKVVIPGPHQKLYSEVI